MQPHPRGLPPRAQGTGLMGNRVKQAIARKIDESEAQTRAATRQEPAGTRERPPTSPIPRIALTRDEAAASLGMNLGAFERHVQPDLRLIRRGKVRLVSVRELERWADEAADDPTLTDAA